MKIGLWIDHTKAVIVSITGKKENILTLESNINKQFRSRAGKNDSHPNGRRNVTAGDIQDREFAAHLSIFYKSVILHLREAESILIFGPGEPKGEFTKRIMKSSLSTQIVGIETADKMTDPQIIAKTRKYFNDRKVKDTSKT